MLGFTFAGYALFGSGASNYRSITWSFISCFQMTVGGYDYTSMSNASPIIAPIYFVVFIILFFLIILNMFISIIGVAYEDTMGEEMKDHKSKSTKELIENELRRFFRNIIASLDEENRKKIKNSLKDSKEMTELKQECMSKLPILYRIFRKILNTELRMGEDSKDGGLNKKEEKKSNMQSKQGDKKGVHRSKRREEKKEQMNPILGYFVKGKDGGCKEKLDEKIREENYLEAVDKDQRVMWLSMLENKLYEKTDRKVKLTDFIKRQFKNETSIEFYPKLQAVQLSDEVKRFVFEDPKSMIQEKLWVEADVKTKYAYWCGLDIVFAENYKAPLDQEKKKRKRMDSVASLNQSGKDVDSSSDDEKEVIEDLPPLAPRTGEISLKSMFLSGEYSSVYAKSITWLQLYYWNLITQEKKEKKHLEEKKKETEEDRIKEEKIKEKERVKAIKQQIELWLFYFTPKQRCKLWKRMPFSQAGIIEYGYKNLPSYTDPKNKGKAPKKELITIDTIWDAKVSDEEEKKEEDQSSRETKKEIKETPENQKYKIGLMHCIYTELFFRPFVWKANFNERKCQDFKN